MSEEVTSPTPRRFADVIGHAATLTTLTRAFESDRAHHALLFTGPPGVGKRTVADILGRSLLCERGRIGEPCGHCGDCRRVLAGSHADWIVLEPVGAYVKIDAIRQLSQTFAFRSFEGGRRIVIIEPADRMTDEASNALLKTLEEPPAGSYLILITAHRAQLLPTIGSRCQEVAFAPLTAESVGRVLERLGVGDARAAAAYSGGSPGMAQALLVDPIFAARDELLDAYLCLMTQTAAQADVLSFGDWVEAPAPDGAPDMSRLDRQRTSARRVIELVSILLRDLMLLRAGGARERLVHSARAAALSMRAAELTWPELSEMLLNLRAADEAVEGNVTPRLVLEALAARTTRTASPTRQNPRRGSSA